MSIELRHKALTPMSSQWLVDACNLFRPLDHPVLMLDSPMVDVLRAAELHGVLPLVLRRLRHAEIKDDATIAAIDAARTLQLHQSGMELLLRHHGERAVQAFSDAGIQSAVVKGPTFADRLYSEPTLRTFTDIDILIPLDARGVSSEVMAGLGFKAYEREYREDRDFFEDVWLLAEDERVSLEVHSDLVHNPKLRRRATLGYESLLAAGAGDPKDATALLHVAATHGAMSHQFDRIQHLLDVALAANGAAGPVNAERLLQVCQSTGTKRAVYSALVLADAIFNNSSARTLAQSLAPTTVDRLAARLVTFNAVAEARSDQRQRLSWRRGLFRQALRIS